jgi:outer membrane receptor for ferrienterochelin and colicin
MNKPSLLLLFFLIALSGRAQRYTVSGYISDKNSRERLINANVYEASTLQGTTANNFGFYSISLPKGEVKITASFIGYSPQEIDIDLNENTTINFELNLRSDQIEEITVTGNQTNKIENTQMSMIDVPVQKLQNIPTILGEADVLKVIQLLPGVQGGTEGTSGIYVRGGGPDQNLFLLDGVPVYNAGHLLGIFSVFNPDALRTVKLYKGAFPARYGGRLSSVVDVSMKDGNMQQLKGDFSIGLISSKLMLEGPIVKDKTSFMVSGRRSYADLLAQPIIAAQNKNNQRSKINGLAFFHDFNFKLNHIFSDKSRLYWSLYHGRDKGKAGQAITVRNDKSEVIENLDNQFGLGWGNTISSVRWNYLISPKLFSNTTVTYSKYNFDIFSDESYHQYYNNSIEKEFFEYSSGIEDIAAKIDFDYFPTPRHAVKFGTSYINHKFSPGVTTFKFSNTADSTASNTTFGNRDVFANELSAYIEDDITISTNLKLNAGFHFSAFFVDGKTYFSPQPRLSARWLLNPDWSVKASYSRMAQHVHLLTMSGIDLPSDLWVPVTKNLAPPTSNQFALGTALKLPHKLDLSVEGFYKDMNNLIEYKEGASFMKNGTEWEKMVELGKGWSYGVEVLLEKTIGKTTGWLGYTWSKTERQFEKINFGRVFPAKYDRRHDLSLVLTHKFSNKFDISGSWVYATGSAATLAFSHIPIGNIPYAWNFGFGENYVYAYESRNNYRMPDFHRLDLGVNFHKQKKRGVRTWNISVYNAYNRNNALLLMWMEEDKDGEMTYGGGSMFNSGTMKLFKATFMPIIPSVSYSFKF